MRFHHLLVNGYIYAMAPSNLNFLPRKKYNTLSSLEFNNVIHKEKLNRYLFQLSLFLLFPKTNTDNQHQAVYKRKGAGEDGGNIASSMKLSCFHLHNITQTNERNTP